MLFAGEPRWAPPLGAHERWLFSRRHPYDGEVDRFLVRQGPGRIAVHHREGDDVAWFGGFDAPDDVPVVGALVDAARAWAAERGASRLAGPALFSVADGDAGILVSGFDWPGGTGRPWHPPWYAARLAEAGLEPVGEPMPRWRLPTGGCAVRPAGRRVELPAHAGRLADRDLVLDGIAAVPDVSAAARAASLRRPPPPTEAAVVRCDGDPAELVPALQTAASAYEWLWAPWSPDDRPPDTVHRLFGCGLQPT